jgi:hypothetical protein
VPNKKGAEKREKKACGGLVFSEPIDIPLACIANLTMIHAEEEKAVAVRLCKLASRIFPQ